LPRFQELPKSGSASVRRGHGGTCFAEIFKALGIPAVVRNGAWADILRQAASGELDGLAFALGAPAPEVAAFDAKDPLDFI